MNTIKEILCLAHSHFDIGYTHPQQMLLQLQGDYIDQAIDLCVQTADYPEEAQFRWTCEAALPVLTWFETASEERKALFRRLVAENRISVCAFPFHFTPNATTAQITQWLTQLEELRRLTGAGITAAISHDVNGVPWPLASLLLDAGVKFFVAGPNIHFGGIPFPRPYAFAWEAPDGRKLPFMLGEHYSLFSQFLGTESGDVEQMREGAQRYVERIAANKLAWDEDFLYLTATNPLLYDNNSPDANVADMVRRYNEAGYTPRIRFVTPEMLYARFAAKCLDRLPVHTGDWTDYWNFGTASTARETKFNRKAKVLVLGSEFLGAVDRLSEKTGHSFTGYTSDRSSALDKLAKNTDEAYRDTLLFDEHTWGTYNSVSSPDSEESYSQMLQKKEFALKAMDRSAYLAGVQLERFAGNPIQADKEEELILVNPTDQPLCTRITLPQGYKQEGRKLAANRIKEQLRYDRLDEAREEYGHVALSPFSARRIPLSTVLASKEESRITRTADGFTTPFYRVILEEKSREITQIIDLKSNRPLLAEKREWKFFDVVEETVDPAFDAPEREAIFSRDVILGNNNVSQWKHGWRALRTGCKATAPATFTEQGGDLLLTFRSTTPHMAEITRTVRFSSHSPVIELDVAFCKREERGPLGIYTVFPLHQLEGWHGYYDTADTVVRLDNDQLGHACRDYVTVDRAAAVCDREGGVILACPDAPMVQFGDFNFGHENTTIPRTAEPLLLGWPMNNYWNTNFPASEDGYQHFHWELTAIRSFSPKMLHHAGLQAQQPLLVTRAVQAGAAMQADGSEQELLHFASEACGVLWVRPASFGEEDGCLVAIENFSEELGRCALSFPGMGIKKATQVDLCGNTLQELRITDGQELTITLKRREIQFIFVR